MPEEPHQYAALPVSLAPRPRTHKLIGMLSVILSAIALIMGGYLAVGFAGYLAFPLTVGGNVLNAFPLDDVVMQVAPSQSLKTVTEMRIFPAPLACLAQRPGPEAWSRGALLGLPPFCFSISRAPAL